MNVAGKVYIEQDGDGKYFGLYWSINLSQEDQSNHSRHN